MEGQQEDEKIKMPRAVNGMSVAAADRASVVRGWSVVDGY
jgi:hypothetical protein